MNTLTLIESVTADAPLAMALSPDGRWIACTGNDGNVSVWEAATMTVVKQMKVGKRPKAVAFSPDSSLLVAGASTLMAFSTTTWKKAWTCKGHRREVVRAVFSTDGARIFGGGHSDIAPSDNSVRVWDVASSEEKAKWVAYGSVSALVLSPDGTTLAVGTSSGQTMILDAGTLTPRWPEAEANLRVHGLRFAPDGRLYGATSAAPLFEIDLVSGARRDLIESNEFGSEIVITADGRHAFVAVGKSVLVVDLQASRLVASHALGESGARSLALSPDGRRLYMTQHGQNALFAFEVS